MTASSDFERIFQLRKQAREAATHQQAQSAAQEEAQVARDKLEREQRVAALIERKRQHDKNRGGTDPKDVFGSEAMPLIQGFLDHMRAAGWPSAQTLIRDERRLRTNKTSPVVNIFLHDAPPDTPQLRGYCIGVTHSFDLAPHPDPKVRARKLADASGFTAFTEKEMVYLCEDGQLRVGPSFHASVPLIPKASLESTSGELQESKALKPVTPGVFETTEALRPIYHEERGIPGVAWGVWGIHLDKPRKDEPDKYMLPVTGFTPAGLQEVLLRIAENPASGAPKPGFIPELHSDPYA